MAVVRAALAAVDAGALVRAALETPEIIRAVKSAAAIDVVAVGKGALPMILAAPAVLPRVPLRQVIGISTHRAEHLPAGVRWHVASHPVPNTESVAAAQAALAVARAATAGDLLLVLLSGGASAMMALPAEGISLDDKRRTSQQLLESGAEVHALNAVRKHLSAIKGGQLAAASQGSVLTLAVSDVVGNEPTAIGSGPTVPDSTTFADALDALQRYGGTNEYPSSVVQRLIDGLNGTVAETPKPGDPRLARATAHVIGASVTAVEGARAAAEALGYSVQVIENPVIGEARAAGDALVDAASRAVQARAASSVANSVSQREVAGISPDAAWTFTLRDDRPLCILAAGETTVRVVGAGWGGRNQECALGMVRRLNTFGRRAVGASVGTDGLDGPTDAAGAVVDSTTLSRAMAAGLAAPERYLDNNDSYRFFDRLGDLIRTGPTNTNVGDLQVILVG
jgi:glycerate-2-kinase